MEVELQWCVRQRQLAPIVCSNVRFLVVPMSYQERELSLPASSDMDPQVDDEVLITGVDWSGNNGDGQPSLLVVSYMHHGIR